MSAPVPSITFTNRLFDWLFGRDFFISYRWSDGRDYAVKLAQRLKAEGFDCFLDSDGFIKGDDWRPTGDREIRKTSRLVLLGTPDIHSSEAVARELAVFGRKKGRLIAVEFGDALSREKHPDSPVLANLDPHIIRQLEPLEALAQPPSEELIQELRRTFTVETTAARRRRVIRIVTGVLVFLFVTAVVMAFVAENQRQMAVAKQIEATRNLADTRFQLGQSSLGQPYSGNVYPLRSVHQFLRAAIASDHVGDLDERRGAVVAAHFAGDALSRTILHGQPIKGVVQSTDGRVLLSWAVDGGLRLWHSGSGQPIGAGMRLPLAARGAVISGDGTHVIAWVDSGMAHLWDCQSGRLIEELQEVDGAAFTSDGTKFVTWGKEGAVLCNTADGSSIGHPMKPGGLRTARAFFQAGDTQILTWTDEGSTRLWNAADGAPIGPEHAHPEFEDESQQGFAAAYSPDGHLALTEPRTYTPQFWTAMPAGIGVRQQSMRSSLRGAAFSPDGRKALVWADNGTARILNAPIKAEGSPAAEDSSPEEAKTMNFGLNVRDASFSPDGKWVLSYNVDGVVRLFKAVNGSPIPSPIIHEALASPGAFFSQDSKEIITWGGDGAIRFWSLAALPWHGDDVEGIDQEPDDRQSNLVVPSDLLDGAILSPDERLLAVWTDNGKLDLWSTQDGKKLPNALSSPSWITSAAFSPDGSLLLGCDGQLVAHVWRTGEWGKPLYSLPFGPAGEDFNRDPTLEAAFSADGRSILTWCRHSPARLWSAVDGSPIGTGLVHAELIGAAFVGTGGEVATWGQDGSLRHWLVADGKEIPGFIPGGLVRTHGEGDGRFQNAFCSPDGGRVLGITEGGELCAGKARIWGRTVPNAGGEVFEIEGEGPPQAMFSPDGGKLLTWARDKGRVRLRDASTANLLGQGMEHEGSYKPLRAQFSRDAQWVLTWRERATARLWRAEEQQLIQEFLHEGMNHALLSPSMSLLITFSDSGSVHFWRLPKDDGGSLSKSLVEFEVRSATTFDESAGATRTLTPQEWQERKSKLSESKSINP